MKKHTTTLILVTWGVLSTFAALYLWNINQRQVKINALLTESISLHKKAIANEVKSYLTIDDCFIVNRGLCNAEEFKKNLQVLGDESDEIYNQIANVEAQLK